ncbi:MAG: Phosphoenolpyruvate synthase [candidate division TM6 bacterium GW2011_GWF2_32_72]|nr:MAG: Phosphoenolpyruvate synthase [candidate division TM6 bacterium GW2011_GWF2_32_72]
MNYKYIKFFSDIKLEDIPSVGGKNASLGEMIQTLSKQGIEVPNGFAVTADAYWYYLRDNNILIRIKDLIRELVDKNDLPKLQRIGAAIRKTIIDAKIPEDLAKEVEAAYIELSKMYGEKNCDIAVRSSATAEDLPNASFAGQQETFLNITGVENLLEAVQKCMASLFTDRAIIYRIEKGFNHFQVGLSVGVQKMVRSDLGAAGVAFSLDTESGFKNLVQISSAYGLGEAVVQGLVTPDEFAVFTTTLTDGFEPIIKKQLGLKEKKIIYSNDLQNPTKTVETTDEERKKFSLTDQEILKLAKMTETIENHYSKLKDKWTPMDVEWGKDGKDGKLYILQARPETVHAISQVGRYYTKYSFAKELLPIMKDKLLLTGESIGQKIAGGSARIIKNIDQVKDFNFGDILVTSMTDPDWVPIMKKAGAIVTDRGGRTCHAAIVSRELGIPAIVGTEFATQKIKDGQEITIDSSQGQVGYVYNGKFDFKVEKVEVKDIPKPPVDVMVNVGDPSQAFSLSFLPVSGVGLARIEFVINSFIKIHPMALLHPEKLDKKELKQIEEITAAYSTPVDFFVDSLAQGVGTIAAAFFPRPVICRFSDFKTNEYRNLIGGSYFEPVEENPMLGFRGAIRYYSSAYRPAFELECKAMKKVRDKMGLKNLKLMVPFVRTVQEAKDVLQVMLENGLRSGDSLEIFMMCEVPSNVLMLKDFAKLFDGFSIGSNDLTQLTLGVDRDSEILAALFKETDPAVQKIITMAITQARDMGKYIGICGQAPSDYPEFAEFLIEQKINSISLNPDVVLPFLMNR